MLFQLLNGCYKKIHKIAFSYGIQKGDFSTFHLFTKNNIKTFWRSNCLLRPILIKFWHLIDRKLLTENDLHHQHCRTHIPQLTHALCLQKESFKLTECHYFGRKGKKSTFKNPRGSLFCISVLFTTTPEREKKLECVVHPQMSALCLSPFLFFAFSFRSMPSLEKLTS